MTIRDIISKLKNDEPNRKTAAKKLLKWGAILFFIAVWNYSTPISSNHISKYSIWDQFFVFAFSFSGILLMIAAYGVKNNREWGERIGQFGLIIFIIGLLIVPIYFNTYLNEIIPSSDETDYFIDIPVVIISIIVILQFMIPAYFMIGYLERLRRQKEKQ
jgi:surface polysaccharide O-acyltransferase-like enzyme